MRNTTDDLASGLRTQETPPPNQGGGAASLKSPSFLVFAGGMLICLGTGIASNGDRWAAYVAYLLGLALCVASGVVAFRNR